MQQPARSLKIGDKGLHWDWVSTIPVEGLSRLHKIGLGMHF